MTFLCVVCAKTVRGRQLLVGVARRAGKRRVGRQMLLLAFYYIWLMTVMAQCRLAPLGVAGRERGPRLGVASLYKIMCFALRRH